MSPGRPWCAECRAPGSGSGIPQGGGMVNRVGVVAGFNGQMGAGIGDQDAAAGAFLGAYETGRCSVPGRGPRIPATERSSSGRAASSIAGRRSGRRRSSWPRVAARRGWCRRTCVWGSHREGWASLACRLVEERPGRGSFRRSRGWLPARRPGRGEAVATEQTA